MISIKAGTAIALTTLGAAAMSADVYLASHATAPPSREAPPAPARVNPGLRNAAAAAVQPRPVLTLEPVMIYARTAPRKAVTRTDVPVEPRELVVCSDWRSLESGPSGRGVRSLCVPP